MKPAGSVRGSNAAERFLARHGMLPDYKKDASVLLDCFCEEIDKRLRGENSSLALLPTYLKTGGEIPEDTPVLVLDAGGTNLRIARLYRKAQEWIVEKTENHPMPGSVKALEKEEYLAEMVRLLTPFLSRGDIDHVGYCFSYSARITQDKDGILDCFNKGVKIRGSEGMSVCRELKEALSKAGCPVPAHWVLLNDSVATCFGGLGSGSSARYDGVIGFVLGTGTNTCYSEDVSLMQHCDLSAYTSSEMLINMECGGISIFPMGDFDLALHADDPQPGVHIYEKMVAGAYLGRLFWYTAKAAGEEGLLSPACRDALAERAPFTTREISDFLIDQEASPAFSGLCGRKSDKRVLNTLAAALIRRAAFFAAVNLAGTARHRGLGLSKDCPALVVAEGSTFWRCCGMADTVLAFLRDFGKAEKGPAITVVSVSQANLCGSAAAALLNA